MPASKTDASFEALRKLALTLAGTDEGIACAGTALEARTVRAGGKAFLFLGPKEMRLKLGSSLGEAKRIATKHPGTVKVGKGDWVSVAREDAGTVPATTLAALVKESHGLAVSKG